MVNKLIPRSVVFFTLIGFVAAYAQTGAPVTAPPVINVREVGAKGDGTTDDDAAINRAIQQAQSAGPGASVYFPAGDYLLSAKTILVKNATGLTLYGDGPATVLKARDGSSDIVTLRGCHDITLQKMTLDRADYSFTQGRVESVNAGDNTCIVTLEPGYPAFDAPAIAKATTFKPFTYPNSGTYEQDHYTPAIQSREKIGDRQWVLHLAGAVDQAWVGKEFITWASPRGIGVVAAEDSNVLLEDVTYYGRGANAGYYIVNAEGTVTLRRFRIDVPPGTGDLLSCGGGGQAVNVRGRLVFDHCTFSKFDDDGADILTNYIRILSQPDPRTLVLQSNSFFHVGDILATVNWPAKTERGTCRITQVTPNPDRSCTVVLDQPVKVGKTGPGVGSIIGRPQVTDGVERVADYDNVTSSTEFRDCEFQCLRARPLNLKAQNCLVEGCKFSNCVLPAIAAGPEFYWQEAPAVHHLTVRNCTFTNCDTSNIDVDLFNADAAINGGVACDSYDNRDILIEGNTFTGYGAHGTVYSTITGCAVHVRYATNVVIRHNVFGDPAPTAPADAPRVLIQHSRNVTIQDNQGLPDSAVRQE